MLGPPCLTIRPSCLFFSWRTSVGTSMFNYQTFMFVFSGRTRVRTSMFNYQTFMRTSIGTSMFNYQAFMFVLFMEDQCWDLHV